MSYLEDTYQKLLDATQYLHTLVEKEHEEKARETRHSALYAFVYEQWFKEEQEWGMNNHTIQAHDIAEAFSTFGFFLKSWPLTVRNIRYGRYEEMKAELDEVHSYWEDERQKRKESEK